ncbi:MAG: hypothetical protein LBP80_07485, partial [Treponema sp.]|nr:hypothetical protein [Treponema sp.]
HYNDDFSGSGGQKTGEARGHTPDTYFEDFAVRKTVQRGEKKYDKKPRSFAEKFDNTPFKGGYSYNLGEVVILNPLVKPESNTK